MDDVDAVQAQIARNMLESGDWVTARLDGVAYLEKAPLVYWTMAASYRVFGVRDWAARLPLALAVVLLCFVTYRFARWAFGDDGGLYAGVALATCVGLYLFTRILIPDAMVTLTITGAVWAWLRLLEPDGDSDDAHPRRWALIMGVCFGLGLLLKGLIAIVFPILAGLAFMAVTRQLLRFEAWRKLRVLTVIGVALVIAVPWHVLAMRANPPYFAFSMHSGPGEYRGFFWFYFFNEHLLRFLNLRYPRDYNTVPRLWFWLFNLAWLFPWSVYLPGTLKLEYRQNSRAARARLMAVCWIAVVMLFFTFSTTQEYYSMPIYPAVALLIGSALASGKSGLSETGLADKSSAEKSLSPKSPSKKSLTEKLLRAGTWTLFSVATLAFAAICLVLVKVWSLPTPGDISQALSQHPELYTLSLGHMGDLTLNSFAYLKLPLVLAAVAFGGIALALVLARNNTRVTVLAICAGMVLFFQAARVALVRFDPYLGSYALATSLKQSPPGQLIEADAYYAFSSVFFYTNRSALLLNGRVNNLEYGSYAPGAPQVFIDDQKFAALWNEPGRCYLLIYGSELPRLEALVGKPNLHVVKENGGNFLLTNHKLP
ncbi:MAG: glycosyltransferase family 39 protein [Acidobacteriia bacterium]|nr:glycosyltransferase family 39 protein [Terriglobia bacterium]